MADYELTVKAEHDLTEIYVFSHEKFGEVKADAYLIGLEECLCSLAENPQMGRNIDHVRQGYFRYEYISHAIFYKCKDGGITVVRVLHGSMNVVERLSES